MKMIALITALVSFAAMAKPNTYNMSCSQAQNLVDSEGAITLYVGSQGLYDRFVANSSYCGHDEKAYRSRITTKDNAKCILKVCADKDNGSGRTITGVRRKCKDGQRAMFTEYDVHSDSEVTVIRTCKNGRYFPYKPQPVPRKCKEGRRSFTMEYDANNDSEIRIATVCRNGRYVPIN